MESVNTVIHISPAGPVGDQEQKVDAEMKSSDKSSKTDQYGKDHKEYRVLSALIRLCSNFPRLRKLLWEFRTFQNRIRIVWSSSDSYRCPSSFLFLEAPSGSVYENTRSSGRIECIRTCVSTIPWATPLDWKIWSAAWDQGVEWAIRNLDFDSSSTSEHKALLKSELSYKGPRLTAHGQEMIPHTSTERVAA